MSGTRVPAGPLRLARGARLRLDPVREKPLLLLPEAVLVLNRTAHEIVRRLDGTRTAARLAAELSRSVGDPKVEAEVLAFLERLAAKGVLEAVPAGGEGRAGSEDRGASGEAPRDGPGKATAAPSNRPRTR